MLRTLILLLLLANGVLLAANLGVFERFAGGGKEREPERLSRQINPDGARLTPGAGKAEAAAPSSSMPADAGPAAAPAPPTVASGVAGDTGLGASTPPVERALPAPGAAPGPGLASAPELAAAASTTAGACLQTGPVVGEQLAGLERSLRAAGLPEGSWRSAPWPGGPGFMIVMGRYPDQATLERKQNELRRRKVDWTALQAAPNLPAELTPGLSLGRFDSEAAADAALGRLEGRGVRTARVVALPAMAGQVLVRLPSVDAALQGRLATVPPPANTRWAPCPAGATEAKKG